MEKSVLYNTLRYIRIPKNIIFINEWFNENDDFKVLDVGCGKSSGSIIKSFFPKCYYYAIDKDKDIKVDDIYEKYYQMDLVGLEYGDIPDNFFDIMIMSHVIEHLANGDLVIEELLPKLKKEGILYIEFPSFNSTKLPSKKGTLNFFDDSTHCRLYSLIEIYNLLMRNNYKILKGGIRRNIVNILLTPYNIVRSKRTKGFVAGSVFWDVLGFCQYVLAVKNY